MKPFYSGCYVVVLREVYKGYAVGNGKPHPYKVLVEISRNYRKYYKEWFKDKPDHFGSIL